MTERIGTERDLGFDAKGFERREMVDTIVLCPTCGAEVALWADTEEWSKGRDGRWHHQEYSGCATGECCGRVIVSVFGEAMVLNP
jgi:hypothetical protein